MAVGVVGCSVNTRLVSPVRQSFAGFRFFWGGGELVQKQVCECHITVSKSIPENCNGRMPRRAGISAVVCFLTNMKPFEAVPLKMLASFLKLFRSI